MAALQEEDAGALDELDDPVYLPPRVPCRGPDSKAVRAEDGKPGAFQEEMIRPLWN